MTKIELGELTKKVTCYLEKEILPLIHSEAYIQEVKKTCQKLAE